jgi:hypothetical protein
MLLVRSSFHLFLFAMAGQTGAVAALTRDEIATALELALSPPLPPAEPSPLQAPCEPSETIQWYLSRGGQSEGPMDEASVRRLLESLPPQTLVWKEGLPNWISAQEARLVPRPAASGCPRCGTATQPGLRFCFNCGHPLT